MKCSVRLEYLIDLAYGQVGDAENVRLLAHVRECEECGARVRALQSLGERLSESLHRPVGAPCPTDAIMSRLTTRQRIYPKLRRPAWAAAAVAVIAMSVFLLTHTDSHHRPTQVEQVAVHERAEEIPAPVLSTRQQPRHAAAHHHRRMRAPMPSENHRLLAHAPRHDGTVSAEKHVTASVDADSYQTGSVVPAVSALLKEAGLPRARRVRTIRLVPPNDAETIDRPPLCVVTTPRNKIPETEFPGGPS